ncbi:2132_t:CDS:1, partial [Scutellospora calospora]
KKDTSINYSKQKKLLTNSSNWDEQLSQELEKEKTNMSQETEKNKNNENKTTDEGT